MAEEENVRPVQDDQFSHDGRQASLELFESVLQLSNDGDATTVKAAAAQPCSHAPMIY